MKVEKIGYAMHYSVEDEGGNIYNVTHYYNKNMNWDSWEILKDEYNSEVRHKGLRESIINSISNNLIIKMKIPDKKTKPFIYEKWKEMDLLNANDIERILMLELDNVISYQEFLCKEKRWDRKDMREFVRDVSQKIQEELYASIRDGV